MFNLEILDCRYNLLTKLPKKMINIKHLKCNNNKLQNLPIHLRLK